MLRPGSTLYEVLEVEADATPRQIHEAYLRIKETYSRGNAALYGLHGGGETEAMLDKIEEAYQVLSNTIRRKEYDDAFRSVAPAPPSRPAPVLLEPVSPLPPAAASRIPPPPTHDPEERDWKGPTLRMIRESMGVSVEEMAQFTKIHTDFEKHFIKADIVPFETFVACSGWFKAREQGKVVSAGRDYIMQEGDVVEFKVGV
jgi:curved DNA-binding protein CbpA